MLKHQVNQMDLRISGMAAGQSKEPGALTRVEVAALTGLVREMRHWWG